MRCKCITLDGDIHDPSGTLTGGYINANQMILARYEEYRQCQEELETLQREGRQIEEVMQKLQGDQDYYNGLRRDIEQKKYKYEKKQAELRRKSGVNIEDQIKNKEKEIEDLRAE